MAGCELDFSALPILTGCPADNETFLVGNAVGGLDVNGMNTVGYARRLWGDLRKCAAAGVKFVFKQFRIGDIGAPILAGATSLVITQAGVLQDSVFITLGGPELPRDPIVDQDSYGVVYSGTGFTINFLAPVQNTEVYIIHYAYSS
jgi:hypothetical protein